MMEPLHDTDNAIIMGFKIYDQDEEDSLPDTVVAALEQIEGNSIGDGALLSRKLFLRNIKLFFLPYYGMVFLQNSFELFLRISSADAKGIHPLHSDRYVAGLPDHFYLGFTGMIFE